MIFIFHIFAFFLFLLQYKLIALAEVGFICELNCPSPYEVADRSAYSVIKTACISLIESPNA